MKNLLLAAMTVILAVACSTASPTPTPTPTQGSTSSPTASSTATTGDTCTVNGVVYCVLNPDVTQATIGQTICVSGWTSTIRPPVSYTEPIKQQEMQEAANGQNGFSLHNGDTNISDYELDHRMPLELGGAPKDINNLSIEYPASPNPKDSDENFYKQQVCSGAMTLAQAQTALVQKWLAQYPGYLQ